MPEAQFTCLRCGIITLALSTAKIIINAVPTGKVFTEEDADDLLVFASTTRHPLRNWSMVLLLIKAGLRAGIDRESDLGRWCSPRLGDIGPAIELHDRAAKKSGGRLIPIHPELR